MLILQYFKIKYGFHPILADWQLDKIKLIFKMEKLQIQATEIVLPSSLEIKWESVGMRGCFNGSLSLSNYYQGVESEYPGRESKKILQPDNLFLSNIKDYLYNRFLDMGMNIE